jgi:large subunit ribosomal protein L18
MDKNIARLRRAKKTRSKIKELGMPRLSVYRTPRHIYAQLIMADGSVKTCASTLDQEVKTECKYGGNKDAASIVGKIFAGRVKKLGISQVAFDRSGFKYHGRIKALADSARENGLEF